MRRLCGEVASHAESSGGLVSSRRLPKATQHRDEVIAQVVSEGALGRTQDSEAVHDIESACNLVSGPACNREESPPFSSAGSTAAFEIVERHRCSRPTELIG